jgi:hypothetical protein
MAGYCEYTMDHCNTSYIDLPQVHWGRRRYSRIPYQYCGAKNVSQPGATIGAISWRRLEFNGDPRSAS